MISVSRCLPPRASHAGGPTSYRSHLLSTANLFMKRGARLGARFVLGAVRPRAFRPCALRPRAFRPRAFRPRRGSSSA
eukprot:4881829-Lingulodinium_polyedra.AAC.1